jgi:hypothetical protein
MAGAEGLGTQSNGLRMSSVMVAGSDAVNARRTRAVTWTACPGNNCVVVPSDLEGDGALLAEEQDGSRRAVFADGAAGL